LEKTVETRKENIDAQDDTEDEFAVTFIVLSYLTKGTIPFNSEEYSYTKVPNT
jgi:hypothetical protein